MCDDETKHLFRPQKQSDDCSVRTFLSVPEKQAVE